MQLHINGTEIAAYPIEFSVTVLDLDDAESTTRTADGLMTRDRVAVKRQIEMKFAALPWNKISAILRATQNVFFDFRYPDPLLGNYTTKNFYVGNRPAPVAIEKNGVLWWDGLTMTLTER
ncbi:hypothetical protein PA598K_01492 [Paenibacillus sp. 598K]|uniref:DUF6711 family protein n=1 Tax=Paenibacillus sp. 598K TaxID=1117987 RepID=UPI000FFA658D|nr:DUF6711 family protein [Paenibacillus sp. 598K]GBF73207.1 hypothetical protein PA598K_01492 [Paenibacillus sp. 598K]